MFKLKYWRAIQAENVCEGAWMLESVRFMPALCRKTAALICHDGLGEKPARLIQPETLKDRADEKERRYEIRLH